MPTIERLNRFKLMLSSYVLDVYELDHIIKKAHTNITQWYPDHIPQAYKAWLALERDQWITVMTSDSDWGQQMRESIPYTGLITEEKRLELYEASQP